jgi:uncharacterized protein
MLIFRSEHFANLKQFADSGEWKTGGAILEEVPVDDEPTSLKFCGSTLVLEAASREEIMATLSKDVYTKSGVWDLEKVRAMSNADEASVTVLTPSLC